MRAVRECLHTAVRTRLSNPHLETCCARSSALQPTHIEFCTPRWPRALVPWSLRRAAAWLLSALHAHAVMRSGFQRLRRSWHLRAALRSLGSAARMGNCGCHCSAHTGFQHELRPEIGPSSRKTLRRRRRLRGGVAAARGSSARGTLPKCLKAYASGRVSSFGYGATLACCEVSAALQCDCARWRPCLLYTSPSPRD